MSIVLIDWVSRLYWLSHRVFFTQFSHNFLASEENGVNFTVLICNAHLYGQTILITVCSTHLDGCTVLITYILTIEQSFLLTLCNTHKGVKSRQDALMSRCSCHQAWNLHLILGIHKVARENWHRRLSPHLHLHTGAYVGTCMCTHKSELKYRGIGW